MPILQSLALTQHVGALLLQSFQSLSRQTNRRLGRFQHRSDLCNPFHLHAVRLRGICGVLFEPHHFGLVSLDVEFQSFRAFAFPLHFLHCVTVALPAQLHFFLSGLPELYVLLLLQGRGVQCGAERLPTSQHRVD